jgi:hypothetical protein
MTLTVLEEAGSFIREAGVAGEGIAARGKEAAGFAFLLLAFGGGKGGGGMSERASGETELFSSVSSRRLARTLGLEVRRFSTASLSTWLTMEELVVFRR